MEAITTSNMIVLLLGLLMLAGALSTKISARVGVPALVVFVGLGMLLGRFFYFDDAFTTQLFGTLALIAILFEGGLNTSWPDVRPVYRSALSLATLGVAVTALVLGVLAHYLLGISWLEGMLFGSIVGSTDAAAVFAVIGGQSIRKSLAATITAESGLNDPTAIFLSILFIQLLTAPQTNLWSLGLFFLQQIGIGCVVGLVAGKAVVAIINRVRMQSSGLYPILTLACATVVYALTALLSGSGFLAVYIMAIIAGNSELVYRPAIFRFNEGFAWMMQIFMFVLLGWLVFPEQLTSLAAPGFSLAVLLMILARPVGVWVSLFRSEFSRREKIFISWAGLKGAVPILLGTYPLLAELPNAKLMFNATFFVVMTSALLQGSTVNLAARVLGLTEKSRRPSPYAVELVALEKTDSEIIEIVIDAENAAAHKEIRELSLPETVLIVAIMRDNALVTPRGDTRLAPEDVLYVLTPKRQAGCIQEVFATSDGSVCNL